MKFENGREISNVVVSTAMGISGSGMFPYTLLPGYRSLARKVKENNITVISKSSTFSKRRGNFILLNPWTWKYIQRISGGSMLNAYGLTNGGIYPNSCKIAAACNAGFDVIPSFYPEFCKGTEIAILETQMAIVNYLLEMRDSFWILEVNASCPNSQEKIDENMIQTLRLVEVLRKRFPGIKIIIKSSVVHPNYFYKDLENAGVDVLHLFNTIFYDLIFPGETSPLVSVGGGGVSGKVTFPLVYEKLQEVASVTRLPKILGCGITNTTRARKFFALGQPNETAVSICTAFLQDFQETIKIMDLN